MSVTKKGFLQKKLKQLGLKRYEPVWVMVHKLRKKAIEIEMQNTLWKE